MRKIAIVEDDKLFNKALQTCLKKEGYEVESGYSCREGKQLIQNSPDLLLLDMGLPDGSGISVCEQAEEYGDIPVIFFTARDEEIDMIRAFDAGCDDYVVKPFPLPVLMKKIQAVLRRSQEEKDVFHYKELSVDYEAMKVFYKKQEIRLTGKEYKLLEYFVKNKGQVLTMDTILEGIWDIDGMFVGENAVRMTVNRIRKKIEPDASNPVFIKNVFGVGYVFGD